MNILSNDFVLEIGSGHNPNVRADVLCDKFIDDDEQRGGMIVTDRPLVEADGQYLPFVDGAFDYVICMHVLEHVEDPDLLLTEMMRVSSRGYIETPSEIGERIYGWPYHNWVVNEINGHLVLHKNPKQAEFGQLFHTLAAQDRHWRKFHIMHHDLFLVQHEWNEKIDYEILLEKESPLNLSCPQTIERLLTFDLPEQTHREFWLVLKSVVPRSIVSRAKSLFARKRMGRLTKSLKEIIICPKCKDDVLWNEDRILCRNCDKAFPIVDGIPRMNVMPMMST
ncbi:methyltransferase domain-containing protein [Candidatus Poribacteria bacterium]|nr:methyltransferase domain-containing protein [Candidatus Poribacteria bacterium]